MRTIAPVENGTAVRTARQADHEELATTVIETVAAAEGIDPLDLDVRIGDVLDPDALNALFDSATNRSGQFTFPLAGYLVRVSATGEVALYRRSRQAKRHRDETDSAEQRVRVVTDPR
ncbi:MAG: hypothetical protein M8354_14875 [Halalkalicoccus sp.]|nr:hypothetical protein [Halalkalicoccus sp.]